LRQGLPCHRPGLHPARRARSQRNGGRLPSGGQSSPALRKTIEQLARRTQTLLEQSRPFAGDITDRRLALEVGVIQTLAESLAARLTRRDPLSERVHHHPVEAIGLALRGGLGVVAGWLGRIGRHKQPRLGDRQG